MNKSLRRIFYNRNINRVAAIFRYSEWQIVKTLNLFPRILTISKSKILITDKASANEGGGLIYTHKLYDYNNMNLLLIISRYEKQIYFDIGANKGVYSLIASEVAQNSIYSFEPHPVTFSYLEDNITLNKRSNIKAYNVALGATNGTMRFTNIPGSSTNKIVAESKYGAMPLIKVSGSSTNKIVPVSQEINVTVLTLDSFVKQNKTIPTMIKIDVEGFEYEVIKGCLSFLSEVNLLQIEINSDFNKMVKVMNDNGFYGPFYYQHQEKRMRREKFLGNEDPIFINKKYVPILTKKLQIIIE